MESCCDCAAVSLRRRGGEATGARRHAHSQPDPQRYAVPVAPGHWAAALLARRTSLSQAPPRHVQRAQCYVPSAAEWQVGNRVLASRLAGHVAGRAALVAQIVLQGVARPEEVALVAALQRLVRRHRLRAVPGSLSCCCCRR